MELRDCLTLIRTQWTVVVLCTTVTVAIAALWVLRTTPLYASTTTLYVSVHEPGEAPTAERGRPPSAERVASYADLVRGDVVTRAVVDDLDLAMSPSALASKVRARVLPDTLLLQITVTDTDPDEARRLAGALAEHVAAFVHDLERPASGEASPVRATVVDAPSLPSRPSSPDPGLALGLGIVAGVVLGLALVVARELLDTSVRSAEALADQTGAPTLGVVPYDPEAHTKPLVVHVAPRSPRAEAFRQLRTNLRAVRADLRPRRIVVTSAVPGEGTTTTALNLGLALAQAGQRVILVEGDVRRPQLAHQLGLENTTGLTNLLLGRATPGEVLQRWGNLPLEVLPSGPVPPNPSELLQSRAMAMALRELDRRAEVVLIDAPPLLPVTDAALLARLADGAVLVVRHGRTRAEQVRTATGNLAKAGAQLLGTVLTMTPPRGRDARTYGYGYDYDGAAADRRHVARTHEGAHA